MNLKKSSWLKLLFLGIFGITRIFQVNCQNTSLYIGAVSTPEGSGIGITFLLEIQQFTEYSKIGDIYTTSPTFMVLNSAENITYTVNELAHYAYESGTVSAFQIGSTGNLTHLNTLPIIGSKPCHLTIDPSGKYILIASYSTGNVEVYRILADGAIGDQTSNVYAPTDDPKTALAHMVIFEPMHQHVAVAFMGLDIVYFYNLNTNGILTPYNIVLEDGSAVHVRAELAQGSGPRHIAYSLNGKYFYVINELASTITAFSAELNRKDGKFPALQTVSTHRGNYTEKNWASEIVVHPSGKYLFASDRGDNVIGTYSIDASTGHLMPLFFQDTGKTPRHFVIDPTGVALYAVNQDADSIDVFEINDDGSLARRGKLADIKSPACILLKLTSGGSVEIHLHVVYLVVVFALLFSKCI